MRLLFSCPVLTLYKLDLGSVLGFGEPTEPTCGILNEGIPILQKGKLRLRDAKGCAKGFISTIQSSQR